VTGTVRRFRVYDTLSRETRLFVPITPPKVGLFVCGLTPYDSAHIGHAKTAVTFDVVARALRRWGYRVFYIQNVTNIDDRLIERGAKLETDPLALADRHFASWIAAMDQLRVTSVNYYPFATDYLPEILQQIQQLIDRGFAYAADGSVYYEVAKFPDYGKLSGQKVSQLRPGTRIEVERSKRSPEDFVLWKAATPGEPTWESPWGPGRPGWHIEDTAITVRLLGDQYDLHGGGLDLKFPHHEAEIAQAEAATGHAPLVRFWMHVGLLNFRGEKMSKSLGNVISLDAVLGSFGPQVLRFFYLNAHYRSPLEFVEGTSLEEAQEAYERFVSPRRRIWEVLGRDGPDRPGEELPEDLAERTTELVEELDEVLSEDLNTREAIARLFAYGRSLAEWIPRLGSLSGTALMALDAPYVWAEEVLGLGEGARPREEAAPTAPLIEVIIEARHRARARNDFAEADRIRDALAAAGVHLEDDGTSTRARMVRSGTDP
jgi:cysteinyl-tRNA synthetase